MVLLRRGLFQYLPLSCISKESEYSHLEAESEGSASDDEEQGVNLEGVNGEEESSDDDCIQIVEDDLSQLDGTYDDGDDKKAPQQSNVKGTIEGSLWSHEMGGGRGEELYCCI